MITDDEKNGAPAGSLPTDALKDAGQQLLGLLVQQAAEAASQRVSGLAERLTDVTNSGGDFRAVLSGDKSQENGEAKGDGHDGEGEDKPGGFKGALISLKDKMKNAFGGGGGSGGAKKLKMTGSSRASTWACRCGRPTTPGRSSRTSRAS